MYRTSMLGHVEVLSISLQMHKNNYTFHISPKRLRSIPTSHVSSSWAILFLLLSLAANYRPSGQAHIGFPVVGRKPKSLPPRAFHAPNPKKDNIPPTRQNEGSSPLGSDQKQPPDSLVTTFIQQRGCSSYQSFGIAAARGLACSQQPITASFLSRGG